MARNSLPLKKKAMERRHRRHRRHRSDRAIDQYRICIAAETAAS